MIKLCSVCKKKPARDKFKTCSKECARHYNRIYIKTEKSRAYQKRYSKAYTKALRFLVIKHKEEFFKLLEEVRKGI